MARDELQRHLDEIGRAGAGAAVPGGLTFTYDDD
jgi:hypothetical protein